MPELGAPASYLTLEPGISVYSCDGEKVGKVERIAAAGDADIFDGLVIDTGMIGAKRYVKAEEIEEIFEQGVLLKLDAERAKHLPQPGEGDTPKA
jgi:hypothetical protein